MDKYVFILLHVVIGSVVGSSPYTKHYRTDYVYNRKTDAFYKLHIEDRRGWFIKELCQAEGAEVMVPSSHEDIAQVHGMFKNFPDLGEYVFVGQDGMSHESAEEQPLIDLDPPTRVFNMNLIGECDVLSRDGKVLVYPCFRPLPFVCKVEAKDAPYDPHCGVYSKNYQYFPSVGSCYKIPRIVLTWNEAYAECQAEGAHLVVINSVEEQQVVKNITNSASSVIGARTPWFFFAGFRADKTTGDTPRIFKTIFNQTLEEAGFSQWSDHEPNNALGNENCGSIFKNNGKFNDVDCAHEYGFICEKEIHA